MRIIAGIARGMTLAVPRGGDTRPTSDRTREAIFSSLGGRVVDAVVLDLFAGTGGLGLEAASRGARAVTFVETARAAMDCLKRNVESARIRPEMSCELEIVREDVFTEISRWSAPVDLIIADPPYGDLPQKLMDEIGLPKLLKEDGLLVLELSKRDKLALPAVWRVVRDAVYGDTRVCFLGRAS